MTFVKYMFVILKHFNFTDVWCVPKSVEIAWVWLELILERYIHSCMLLPSMGYMKYCGSTKSRETPLARKRVWLIGKQGSIKNQSINRQPWRISVYWEIRVIRQNSHGNMETENLTMCDVDCRKMRKWSYRIFYFITEGSEVKKEFLSVKSEMQALTVECSWLHTVHKCRKIYFILSYF